jgi:phage gpG-like protein
MAQINVTIDTRELEREIQRFAERKRAFPMATLASRLDAAVQDLIESEGRGRWDRLKETTLIRHPRRRGGKLLQDTGQLKTMQLSSGPDWAQVTSPAPYAGYHVSGTPDMVRRDFLDLNMSAVLEELAQIIATEIAE